MPIYYSTHCVFIVVHILPDVNIYIMLQYERIKFDTKHITLYISIHILNSIVQT